MEKPIQPSKMQLSWQAYCQQLKATLSGSQSTKQAILRKRILKFFSSYSLDSQCFFFPRREVSGVTNPSLMASDNTLLLFGVDFLSTDDISRYLGCPIQSAYYLDDSHCRITFANFEEAYYALQRLLLSQKDRREMERVRTLKQERFRWLELRPYFEFIFERRLFARFFSVEDMEIMAESIPKHKAYQRAKAAFLTDFRTEDERSKMSKRRHQSRRGHYRSQSRSNSSQSGKNKGGRRQYRGINSNSSNSSFYSNRRGSCSNSSNSRSRDNNYTELHFKSGRNNYCVHSNPKHSHKSSISSKRSSVDNAQEIARNVVINGVRYLPVLQGWGKDAHNSSGMRAMAKKEYHEGRRLSNELFAKYIQERDSKPRVKPQQIKFKQLCSSAIAGNPVAQETEKEDRTINSLIKDMNNNFKLDVTDEQLEESYQRVLAGTDQAEPMEGEDKLKEDEEFDEFSGYSLFELDYEER